jgi:hypothetical protein
MRTTIISSILAIAIAAPALANPGTDQLARSLGVAPGAYSLAELVRLNDAVEQGGIEGAEAVRFITSGSTDVVSSSNPAGAVTANEAQLIELAQLRNATLSADQILAGLRNDATASDRGVVTPTKALIARGLGVDAAAFTTAELVALEAQATFADNAK